MIMPPQALRFTYEPADKLAGDKLSRIFTCRSQDKPGRIVGRRRFSAFLIC